MCIRDRHKTVSVTGYTKRHGREKVHESLEHEALVSRDVIRLYQGYRLRRYATREIAASDFIATCHVRKANGKIPFPTHTVVQAAAVTLSLIHI